MKLKSKFDKGEKMNKDIAEEWTTRLKSGEKKQGYGYLQTDRLGEPAYCCLGVLCEIAAERGIIAAPILEDGVYRYPSEFGPEAAQLPPVVKAWAGMKGIAGSHYDDEGVYYSLTSMNDSGSLNFEQIADHIADNVDNI